MGIIYELTGEKFGKLKVLKQLEERKNKRIQWECLCECGRKTKVITYNLVHGVTTTCGCGRASKFDLIGKKYGELTVMGKHVKNNKRDAVLWECVCDCGNETLVTTSHLRGGSTTSCGLHKGTHRNSIKGKESSEYTTWLSMKNRCNNPKDPSYVNYGERGIKICERWHSFELFLEDMGEKPNEDYSIERIDNNKGYSPDNCIWADKTTQNRNQRPKKNNKSGRAGVHWKKESQKWVARITVNYKRIHLGCFVNLDKAIEAREEAEKIYWKK